MALYQQLLFPALKGINPETAHQMTLWALALAQRQNLGRALLRRIAGQIPHRPVELFGLRFANEIGVAAGFDKDARAVSGLRELGFGHVEVGTVTPGPQPGNPKPRVFRLTADKAIINRMGFPNEGASQVGDRLSAGAPHGVIVGVSLGKQKETALENAADDYLRVMDEVFLSAHYLAVNVSSPNTPGLRHLQGRRYLAQLVQKLVDGNRLLAQRHQVSQRPLLLKISPDLAWDQLDYILDVVLECGIHGIVATNTTLSRSGLVDASRHEIGGLSGLPLRERSTEMIAYIWRRTGGQLPIIGAGGVFTADDVRSKLAAGASLVQLYTGIVYQGPGLAGRILRQL